MLLIPEPSRHTITCSILDPTPSASQHTDLEHIFSASFLRCRLLPVVDGCLCSPIVSHPDLRLAGPPNPSAQPLSTLAYRPSSWPSLCWWFLCWFLEPRKSTETSLRGTAVMVCLIVLPSPCLHIECMITSRKNLQHDWHHGPVKLPPHSYMRQSDTFSSTNNKSKIHNLPHTLIA